MGGCIIVCVVCIIVCVVCTIVCVRLYYCVCEAVL